MDAIGIPDDVRSLAGVNLNHLLYFWAAARAGSVTAAARALGVTQPSVTEQVRTLERRLGAVLLKRTSRGVLLTGAGRRAARYADEVMGICGELVRSLPLRGGEDDRPLMVGAADAVPKIMVRTILEPCLRRGSPGGPVPLVCREWRVDLLLSELMLHRLDVVISDTALEPGVRPGVRSMHAGSSGVVLCAVPALARRLRRGWPGSMSGAPILLPVHGIPLRGAIERWLDRHGLGARRPRVVAEAEDRALLHHLAEDGHGAVAVSAANLGRLRVQFGLVPIATLDGVRDDFYVITIDRAYPHPAVDLIIRGLAGSARTDLRAERARPVARQRLPGVKSRGGASR